MARFRAVASRIRLRKRNDLGVASTYSSIDVLDRTLETHAERRFQLNPFAFALAAHVGKMFSLARIDRQIFWPRVFAHDHPLVNVFLRSDEQPAALLNVIERVSHADSRFHRYHHAAAAAANLALEWCVLTK